MQNYNFENLNDKEFEALVNDLVSAREKTTVNRFKPGRDGGVDGRFFTSKNKEVVIQSKHWTKSGISKLISHCKASESSKVKSLKPHRYIFATSLELSRSNKENIMGAFTPYIVSHNDILGNEGLNDLLAKFPDVEKRHYKLWLSSSTVLDAMLNSALTGRSEAKRDEIIEKTKLYVVTENHDLALSKLDKLHSVLITGEGGIGKTTLADQLSHHYVGQGYELCVIEDDFSEAESKYSKDAKQLFYYDDFLGRNYLIAIEGRKDSRVLSFMDRVAKDKHKRFILTSRSTVLKQGLLRSDLLDIKKVEGKEYEITIDSLSVFDRAKILYNHLWNSRISEEHIDELYVDRRYRKIATHPNFNPRLIAFITDQDRLSAVQAKDYWTYISDMLDNPKDIWSNVYDNQIDELTRIAVCLLVFNGSELNDAELRAAVRQRAILDGIVTTSNAASQYEKMIRAGVGSILRRTISFQGQDARIGLFNPSVVDFVIRRHLSDHDALFDFFNCLMTEQSLLNLRSLRDNSSLTSGGYHSILKRLGESKVDVSLWKDHPAYFLRLVHMIVTENVTYERCDGHKVIEQLAAALKVNGFHKHISLLSQILISAYKRETELFKELSKNFIRLAAKEAATPDELVSLAKLRSVITEDSNETELLDALRQEAISFWLEEAHYIVSSEMVLEDYLYGDQDDEAYDTAQYYIRDALEPFSVSDEAIWEITDTIDFEQIKDENIDSRYPHDGRRAERSAVGDVSDIDDVDEAIDDLFDRD